MSLGAHGRQLESDGSQLCLLRILESPGQPQETLMLVNWLRVWPRNAAFKPTLPPRDSQAQPGTEPPREERPFPQD